MHDVIASISTAVGVGAISIVRVSGEGSIEVVDSIYNGKNKLVDVDSHTINYGHIEENGEIIDEVLVSVMKGPKTFTTEDVVEINCHGGIATTNKVLELLLLNGARLAEPGEFTKRAFLNGRIDLVEAESVMDVINAKVDSSRKLSINQLDGKVSKVIRDFRQELLELIANIEVNIDYPEYEDIEVMTIESIKSNMENIETKLNKIVEESESGKIIRDGIKTVIVGRPNVGKSSILNKLLEYDKAIVTDVAGTTRDIVEGEINLGGILLKLVDTAGIRETSDIVEKIGVDRSYKELEDADLIIMVLNNNEELSEYDLELLEKIKDKTCFLFLPTKRKIMSYGICDLSVIPIRKEGSHTSEMVSQLLYNEVYEVLDEKPGWKLIRTTLDQYEGWIQGIQHHDIDTEKYHEIQAKEKYVVDRPTLAYRGRLLSLGTVINEPVEGTMMMSGRFSPAMMIEFAQKFMDTPYLWGGRSIFGIDCSGFVQLCARAAGKLLPRDASQQINEGELVYFLPEVQPGDLAFFGNENGQIVHVGMMLDTERILHASGQVRIDYLDQTGIFNKERNEHTHRLQVIKRIS